MRDDEQLFIGGKCRASLGGPTQQIVSPHTERPIATAPSASAADTESAIAAARQAFDHGPWPRLARVGTFGVNSFAVDFACPFGGFKGSGVGREFGTQGLENYTETQTVYLSPPRHDRVGDQVGAA